MVHDFCIDLSIVIALKNDSQNEKKQTVSLLWATKSDKYIKSNKEKKLRTETKNAANKIKNNYFIGCNRGKTNIIKMDILVVPKLILLFMSTNIIFGKK